MLALVAVAAMVAPVFTAAISGLLPDVLDGDRYVLGRSVFNLTGSGTQIVGLGIGGAVLAVLPVALAAAGRGPGAGDRRRRSPVSACGPASARAPRAVPRGQARGILRATMAGNAELLADRPVRGLLLAQWLPAWFVAGAESLIVPYTGSLGRPASAAGPLLAAMPAGMLLGDVLVGRFCPPAPRAAAGVSRWPRRWGCRCSRWLSARRCRSPAWPCWPAVPVSPTSSASSRPSSTACRNGGGARASASTRPGRWAARA